MPAGVWTTATAAAPGTWAPSCRFLYAFAPSRLARMAGFVTRAPCIALVVIGYIALVFSLMGMLILGCTGTRPRDLAGGIAEGDTAEMQPIQLHE